MTDDDFLSTFEACTLDPQHFNHRGHVRLAWLYLQRYEFDEAVARTCHGIRAYAAHLGAGAKFHWTVTQALMQLLHAAGGGDRALGWDAFVSENSALIAEARLRLAQHYSEELLDSSAARAGFVAPDRAPLPQRGAHDSVSGSAS
jgi:hypothetical protein